MLRAMTSRRGQLLMTRTVQTILNALMPADAFLRATDFVDGMDSQAGVFLESKEVVISDSFWMEWYEGARKAIRRRVVVTVRVDETELESTP